MIARGQITLREERHIQNRSTAWGERCRIIPNDLAVYTVRRCRPTVGLRWLESTDDVDASTFVQNKLIENSDIAYQHTRGSDTQTDLLTSEAERGCEAGNRSTMSRVIDLAQNELVPDPPRRVLHHIVRVVDQRRR